MSVSEPSRDPSLPDTRLVDALVALVARGDVLTLTGAGASTASGIPDYRGPGTRARAKNPVQFREFVRSADARRRYWARSVRGYRKIRRAAPNAVHAVLATLAQRSLITGLTTQNVDGLHACAGHPAHVELHGALREVVCLGCRAVSSRDVLQERLRDANPTAVEEDVVPEPDGDAALDDATVSRFRVVDCERCGGILKPHVVFFGESVPRDRVDRSMEMLGRARSLLVVGSSLAVFSGFRFVRAAKERGVPVAIVSYGETRGDALAALKIDGDAGETLMRVASELGIPVLVDSTPREM